MGKLPGRMPDENRWHADERRRARRSRTYAERRIRRAVKALRLGHQAVLERKAS